MFALYAVLLFVWLTCLVLLFYYPRQAHREFHRARNLLVSSRLLDRTGVQSSEADVTPDDTSTDGVVQESPVDASTVGRIVPLGYVQPPDHTFPLTCALVYAHDERYGMKVVQPLRFATAKASPFAQSGPGEYELALVEEVYEHRRDVLNLREPRQKRDASKSTEDAPSNHSAPRQSVPRQGALRLKYSESLHGLSEPEPRDTEYEVHLRLGVYRVKLAGLSSLDPKVKRLASLKPQEPLGVAGRGGRPLQWTLERIPEAERQADGADQVTLYVTRVHKASWSYVTRVHKASWTCVNPHLRRMRCHVVCPVSHVTPTAVRETLLDLVCGVPEPQRELDESSTATARQYWRLPGDTPGSAAGHWFLQSPPHQGGRTESFGLFLGRLCLDAENEGVVSLGYGTHVSPLLYTLRGKNAVDWSQVRVGSPPAQVTSTTGQRFVVSLREDDVLELQACTHDGHWTSDANTAADAPQARATYLYTRSS